MNLDFILAFVVGLSLFGVIVGFWWFKKTKAKISVAEVSTSTSSEPGLRELSNKLKASGSEDEEIILWLKKSGNPKGWTVDDFKAAKISNATIYGLGGFGLTAVMMLLTQMWVLGFVALVVALFGAWFGYGQPKRMLIGKSKKRVVHVQLQMPSLLTSVALADGAGYTPETALKVATDELPHGTLKGEMQIILQLLSTGSSLSAALANFRTRIESPMVEEFTQKIYDGATTGQPLAKAMTDLAEVAFQDRAAAMSMAAKKASQKIMFMVVPGIILPADVIVLLYPMIGSLGEALG